MATTNVAADTYLDSNAPTTNYGTDNDILVGVIVATSSNERSILKFTGMSAYSGWNHELHLFVTGFSTGGAPGTQDLKVYRLTQVNWVEAQATYNVYSTGNAWSAGGAEGDYTTSNGATLSVNFSSLPYPPFPYEYTIDVTAQCNDGITATGGDYHCLFRWDSERISGNSYRLRFGTLDRGGATIPYIVSTNPTTIYQGELGEVSQVITFANVRETGNSAFDEQVRHSIANQFGYNGEQRTATFEAAGQIAVDFGFKPTQILIMKNDSSASIWVAEQDSRWTVFQSNGAGNFVVYGLRGNA